MLLLIQGRVVGACCALLVVVGCTAPNPAFLGQGAIGDAEWGPDTGAAGADSLAPDLRSRDAAAPADDRAAPPDAAPVVLDAPGGSADAGGPPPDATVPACLVDLDCGAGLTCVAGACHLTGGLALYWRFDEANGATVLDGSGHGLDGAYTGTTVSSPSALVPAVKFVDPLSRAFVLASTQAAFVALSAPLKPANNFSISIWYRTTVTDTAGTSVGSGLFNAGNNVILRLRPTQIEFSKKILNTGTGSTTVFVQCFATVTNHLNGNWHHLAAVSSPAGMKTYFDGTEICANTQGGDARYNASGNQLWVGQHATLRGSDRFGGNVDELRFYTRALSAAEVSWLAGGRP